MKQHAGPNTKVPKEKRGPKGKVNPGEIKKTEDVINDGNIRHRALPWAELAAKAGLIGDKEVYFHTVRKVSIRGTILLLLPISYTNHTQLIQDREYHKCTTCTKNWLAGNIMLERRMFSRDKLSYKWPDWKIVRWSNEIYFGLGPEKKLRIIRRPGERLCYNCI